MRTTVLKDGHLLSVHILDPKVKGDGKDEEEDGATENVEEKANAEEPEKEREFVKKQKHYFSIISLKCGDLGMYS